MRLVHHGAAVMSATVSVVIAALDAAHTIGAQLDALASQTYRGDFEVLVCDNGSTDSTRELVLARHAVDPRVLLVDASNRRGSAYARNVGVSRAAADIVAFCDADDVVAPHWLEAMVASASRHAVVAGRIETTVLNPAWTRVARTLPEGIQQAGFLPFAGAGNLLVHRQVFEELHGFDTDLLWLEDVDFSWRLQLAGHDLGYAPDALVHVRLRQSITGIFTQGLHYGQAMAQLEQRYAGEPRWNVSSDDVSKASDASRRDQGMLRRALRAVVSSPGRGGCGFVLWQIGWHVGNRRIRRPVEHANELPAGPTSRANQVSARHATRPL